MIAITLAAKVSVWFPSLVAPLMGQVVDQVVAQGGGQGGSSFDSLFLFVAIGLVFYFIVFRPVSTQEKARKKRLENLSKGDDVVISGGIIGKVSSLGEDGIAMVEIADRVKVKVFRKEISDLLEHAIANKKTDKSSKSKDKPASATETLSSPAKSPEPTAGKAQD